MTEEKRKFLRFECLVPVELVEVEASDEASAAAVIKNVSRDGIRIVLDLGSDLQPGTDLQFKISSPEPGQSCSLQGEVIWTKAKSGKVEVGLKIKHLDECAKAGLLEIGYEQWRKGQAKLQGQAKSPAKPSE
jgi:hypothetical protein